MIADRATAGRAKSSMKQKTPGTRRIPDLTVVLVGCLAASLFLIWKFPSRPPASPGFVADLVVNQPVAPISAPAEKPGPLSTVENQWGIRVSGVRLTSSNLVMELRYEVTDPAKAASLADGTTAAAVLDPVSGRTIRIGAPPQRPNGVSPHSRARSAALMMREAGSFPPAPNRIVPGKIYCVQLPNLPNLVRKGSEVVVVIGNARTDLLTVE